MCYILIHADKIYRTRDNLKFCKKKGIRLSGPALGRPPKETAENEEQLKHRKAISRQDEIDRIPIEGKFGQGKRRFGLGRIMSKGPDTSACSIVMSFLVMNLMKWLKVIFYVLFLGLSDRFNLRVRLLTDVMNDFGQENINRVPSAT